MSKSVWNSIGTAPRDRRILVKDSEDASSQEVYICWWVEDAYESQGGRGGPIGWFSGRYADHWGDRPTMENPVLWTMIPG